MAESYVTTIMLIGNKQGIMKRISSIVVSLIIVLAGHLNVIAQETVSSSGGDASSADGTVSYSIGQVFYAEDNDADGSLTPGVQQAYEISVSDGIEEAAGINLTMTVFPNPTLDQLTLSIENFSNEDLSYQLFDMAGRLIMSGKLNEQNTQMYMADLERATYMLLVNKDNKNIKTFKIIKN